MNTGTEIAILAGSVIVIGVAAYAILQAKGSTSGHFILQTQAGAGGTINPAPSPSGISEVAGQVVTLTASPNSGYAVGNWLLDGVEAGNGSSIQVTMDMDHSVIVTFWEGGVEPPSYPVAITNLGSAQVWGYYGCKISLGALNAISKIEVKTCDENWGFLAWAHTQMQFKVIDSSGKGVPNQAVDLYPDMFPDASKYIGYLILNDVQLNGGPLTLTTDQNGVVSVNLSYFASPSSLNQGHKLPFDAGLTYSVLNVVVPLSYAPYDGSTEFGIGPFISKSGHGTTGQTPAMGNITANNIHAKVKNTSIPEALGLCYCGFNVKML